MQKEFAAQSSLSETVTKYIADCLLWVGVRVALRIEGMRPCRLFAHVVRLAGLAGAGYFGNQGGLDLNFQHDFPFWVTSKTEASER